MQTLLGNKCKPVAHKSQYLNDTWMRTCTSTCSRCGGEHHSLEPHREEVSHRKIADRHQCVAEPYEQRHLLRQEIGWENGLGCYKSLEEEEKGEEGN